MTGFLSQILLCVPPKPPQTKEKESSQTVHYTATKTNAKKRHMDHIIIEADKKINDSFETLNNILKTKKKEEDECDVYASLLAKKLRKYPERMRDRIMYKIDGLLLDNPYPDDERSSSASTSYSVPSPYAQQTFSTPSPQYVPTPSPQYFPTPPPQYDPPVYVLPSQNLPATTSQAPVYLHIPEENINMQNEVILQSSTKERKNISQERQIHVLSQEVIVPSKMSDIIKNAYNDS